MNYTYGWVLTLVLVLSSSIAWTAEIAGEAYSAAYAAGDNWAHYRGNAAGTHYSNLSDINTRNVTKLKVAWVYDTKDELGLNATMESNPLAIEGRIYFISPNGRLICLDGATGSERWAFDPNIVPPASGNRWRRGVTFWSDGKDKRILFTFDKDLYAVDAQSGRVKSSFGVRGRVSLDDDVTSPGAIYRDLIIIGGSTSRIRAFDVRTGALRWTFNTIPSPGEFGHETWPKNTGTVAGANNWSGITVDEMRGIAFVPIAAVRDFYGANRIGDNLFSNSLVALDAATGRRIWHFQAIRHDIWDWDLPAPPTLIKVRRGNSFIDAVAQVSKIGFVYILNRLTGESLFPLVEKPAFPSDVPGEVTPKTQLEPVLPAPFARQHLTPALLTRRTPQAAEFAAAQFAKFRSRGLWDPPSEHGTIILPGIEGGAEWGGAAFDPETGLLYVNSNEIPTIMKLKKQTLITGRGGAGIYNDNCAGCHGKDRAGTSEAPSLIGIFDRMTAPNVVSKIATGGMRMPAFQALATDYFSVFPLMDYLRTGIDRPNPFNGEAGPKRPQVADYVLDGVPRFVDPDGYPAIAPPWGTLNAIDVTSGRYTWKIPLGEYPELVARGFKNSGSENYGGPIITAGGLLFIAATSFDKKIRAYDKGSGKLLWESVLPAAGNATPSTYRANGKQFIVIPAGGGRPLKAESGSKILAFAILD